MTSLQDTQPTRQSRWIPWAFVGMFAVIFAVNGVMLTFALKSFNGLSVDGAYDRGLSYNETLSDFQEQRSLGWQTDLQIDRVSPDVSRLTLSLFEADGRPVSVDNISGSIRRPTSAHKDFGLTVTHVGRGTFEANIAWPEPGQWDLRLTITSGENTYRLDKNLMVN